MEIVTNTSGHAGKGLKGMQNKGESGSVIQNTDTETPVNNENIKNESSFETRKQQLNQAILKSSLEVSVSAGNEPMVLLYKAAIDGIDEVLQDKLGENTIQNAYDSGLDVSPEATADRIVSMSTGFFSQYHAQNPKMSDEQAAMTFAEIIRGGIDTGFEDAKNILDGLEVLKGDIANNIDITYELVQQGLQDFIDSYVKTKEGEPEPK
ncbi:MAG: DUF5610 domain-containing protein [Methylococcaceae bacterium]|nr:DUF5610 domain-containing protein [Methylococcaceae bacterium]